MIKKLNKILIFFIISLNIFSLVANAKPGVSANNFVLMDAQTGEVLYSNNAEVQSLPASTTKILTALVVFENCDDLSVEVTIGENPPYADGSSLGIKQGEVYTIEELLIGLLLTSGNDTAEALAEYVSGSLEEFAVLMNETAKRVGATNSNFSNPSGLDEETKNLTTAKDLALIMRELIKYPKYLEISSMVSYNFETKPYTDGTERWSVNGNKLINPNHSLYSPFVIAGKTGYTNASKHSFVCAAEKDGQTLIAMLMNGEDKDTFYTSIEPLFEYGFENFKNIQPVKKGDILSEYKINEEITIPLVAKDDYFITKPRSFNEEIAVSVDYESKDLSKTHINQGDSLFNASLLLNGEKVSDMELLSGATREYNDEIARKESIDKLLNNKPLIIGSIITILLVLLCFIKISSSMRRKKRLRKMRTKFNIRK